MLNYKKYVPKAAFSLLATVAEAPMLESLTWFSLRIGIYTFV